MGDGKRDGKGDGKGDLLNCLFQHASKSKSSRISISSSKGRTEGRRGGGRKDGWRRGWGAEGRRDGAAARPRRNRSHLTAPRRAGSKIRNQFGSIPRPGSGFVFFELSSLRNPQTQKAIDPLIS